MFARTLSLDIGARACKGRHSWELACGHTNLPKLTQTQPNSPELSAAGGLRPGGPLEIPGGSWMLLEAPGSSWRLLEAPGGSWRKHLEPGARNS